MYVSLFWIAIALTCYLGYHSYRADPEQFMAALAARLASLAIGAFHLFKGLVGLVLGAAYVICPIDFIPDFLLGIGQLDDLLAGAGGVLFFIKQVLKFPKPTTAFPRPRLLDRW